MELTREAFAMESVVIISGNQSVDIKREIATVSVMDATDRAVAIACLKAKAFMMGANAIVDLRICNTVGDPQFNTQRLYARGKAVKV